MNALQDGGYDCIAIGKINDIYTGEGVTEALPTKNNDDGIDKTVAALQKQFRGMLFTNLVDFDSMYGHRRDPQGYGEALMAFDRRLLEIMAQIGERDLLIITADHGNDPVHRGTDQNTQRICTAHRMESSTNSDWITWRKGNVRPCWGNDRGREFPGEDAETRNELLGAGEVKVRYGDESFQGELVN